MARDRLAALRAQQAVSGQDVGPHQSYPQQRQDEYDYGNSAPYDYDPRADRNQYSSPPPQERRYEDPPPRPTGGGGSLRTTGGPRAGRHGRRPSNPPPLNPAPPAPPPHQPTDGEYYANAWGGDSDGEQVDFNPNRSQYQPAAPAIQRQRSISAGRPSLDAKSIEDFRPDDMPRYDPYRKDSYAPPVPDRSEYYSRHGSEDRVDPYQSGRMSEAPSYGQQNYAPSEKASTVDLVQTNRKESGSSSGQQKKKKGGPTIKAGDVPFEEMGEFFMEISDLQSALHESTEAIDHINSIHRRLLSIPSSDDPQAIALTQNLTTTSETTRDFFTRIKNRIHVLEQGNANLRALIPAGQSVCNLSLADVDVRSQQVDVLKERFKNCIQKYSEVERDSRAANRNRMERQIKIVNPAMSQGEVTDMVRQAEEGGGNPALFSQALLSSGGQRSYAARGALREVESRAAELARIEQTLVELAQLFNDMAMMVEAQDVVIMQVEQNAVTTATEMEKGVQEVKQAVVHAKSARKKRWWCFGIIVVLLFIIVLVIVFEVVVPLVKNRHNNNSGTVSTTATVIATQTQTQTAVITSIAGVGIVTSTAAAAKRTLAIL
ncbi:syntaxin 1B/2/3 [Pseudohyphozyma bogoriensis]|nr:syntaxin 1B/2/3 [Pseudohyphozyma bogoriensis]